MNAMPTPVRYGLALVFFLLASCARAPSFDIVGSFFQRGSFALSWPLSSLHSPDCYCEVCIFHCSCQL
jgi:hypothetical protein